MENVGSNSDDDLHLRRVRSTGDIADVDLPGRPDRVRHSQSARRSEGQPQSPWSVTAFPRGDNHFMDSTTLRNPGEGSSAAPLSRSESPHGDDYEPDLQPHVRSRHMSWNIPPLVYPEEPIRHDRANARPPPEQNGVANTILNIFGYAGPNAKARRETLGLIWNLSFGLAQFVTIITLLAYSAHRESPTVPGFSEWDACERPLGAWNSIWIGRVVLGSILSYWGFRRERSTRLYQEQRDNHQEAEAGRSGYNSPNGINRPTLSGSRIPPVRSPPTIMGPSNEPTIQLPYSQAYARLSLLTSMLSLVWFLTAHILEYTSVNSCRHSSPHLWWLTFGILCILYLMILEIFLLGLLVFILGPVLYLVWNIVLLCLGRHPLQNPHFIKPEIGKLSKTVVDQIPLVLYIPPPPEDLEKPNGGITIPKPIYSYPPKPSGLAPQRKKRFAFFRLKKNKDTVGDTGPNNKSEKGKDKGGKADENREKTWEDHWEAGDYPFVRLEGNRAACAICLMDFEEPKRVDGGDEDEKSGENIEAKVADESNGEIEEVQVGEVTEEDRERLKLEDAGEGPQPLRLLGCGHVFHKTCLDPWLTDVSGRCPVCQRPVEIQDSNSKKKRSRSQRIESEPPPSP